MGIFTDGDEYHRGPLYPCSLCKKRIESEKILYISMDFDLCIECFVTTLKENKDIAEKIKIAVALKKVKGNK